MKWIKDEEYAVKELFEEYGKDFKKISEGLIKRNVHCIQRSPVAVLFKLSNLGLITFIERDNYIKEYEKEKRRIKGKLRSNNLKKTRRNVFLRDDNKCVICKTENNLEFAHIIPFKETKKNVEEEGVTLCKKHHREYDKHLNFELYKKVLEHMHLFRDGYKYAYCLVSVGCEHCTKFFYIYKKEEIKNLKTLLLKQHYRGLCEWCKNPIKHARLCYMCKNRYHSRYEETCSDCYEKHNKEYDEFEKEIDEAENKMMAKLERISEEK